MVDGLMRSIGSLFATIAHAFGLDQATQASSSQSASTREQRVDIIEAGTGPAWGTLSGLTAHPTDPTVLFAVTDKDSPPLRIIEISLAKATPRVVRQVTISCPGIADLDPEAITAKPDGGFWLASEGGRRNSPPNRLVEVDREGRATRIIGLPSAVAAMVVKKGFEGVALVDVAGRQRLYVAFQEPLAGDPTATTRIGIVELATGAWSFLLYPLEQLDDGETTGLSDLLHVDGGLFAAIERDGQGGRKSIKWITTFDIGDREGAGPDTTPPLLQKRLALDLVTVFLDAGVKVEKEIEGLAIAANGEVYAVTDNDNERPTVLLHLGPAGEVLRLR